MYKLYVHPNKSREVEGDLERLRPLLVRFPRLDSVLLLVQEEATLAVSSSLSLSKLQAAEMEGKASASDDMEKSSVMSKEKDA